MGMDPVTAGLIMGGGSAILGADAAKKANKQSKKQLALQQKVWETGREDVTSAYDQALGHLQGAGDTAKRQISERGVQQVAGLKSSAIDRGLYGSSFIDSGMRGIGTDVSRGRAAIDEQTAQSIAGVLQGKAGAMASLAGGQSNAIGSWNFSAGQPIDLLGWAKLFSGGAGGGGGGSSPVMPGDGGNYGWSNGSALYG